MPQDMSRAFLMTLERLAFITVLVISRMIDSIRLEITDSRMGSKVSTVGPGTVAATLSVSAARPEEGSARFIAYPTSLKAPTAAAPSMTLPGPRPRKPSRNSLLASAGNCDHATCDAMVHANHCQHAKLFR